MKKMLLLAIVLFSTIGTVRAQVNTKIRTTPKLPGRETLERMNLTLAWSARVTVDGSRDGIFSIQVIPGRPSQLVVQTFKGTVYLYDGDNGDLLWKNSVGPAFWAPQPAASNDQ